IVLERQAHFKTPSSVVHRRPSNVSSWGKKLILLAFCALMSGAASGQVLWPLPAKTQNTDVLCNTSACTSTQQGKKLAGYGAPITTFVGRYADNVRQETWFHPVETART